MKQFWQQLTQLWQRLEAPQRVTIVLVGCALIAIASFLTWGATRPDMRTLVRDLDRAAVADIVAYLEEERIPYEVVDHGSAVLVPSKHQYALRKNLAEQDLLGDSSTGFELLSEASFADSTFREQKNYDRAVAGELERSFSTIAGVKTARVIVVRPTPSPFLLDDEHQASASVFLDMQEGRRLKDRQVMGVVRLAAGAVEGLLPDQVEVVDNQGPLTTEDPDSAVAMASNALEAERERERHLMQKAQQLLDRALGPGRSMVSVAVDLDFTETSEASSEPTTSVVLRETNRSSDESTPVPSAGGVAGTAANIEGAPPRAPVVENATKTTEDSQRDYVVGERTVTKRDEVPRVAGMTASILLDYKRQEVPAVDENGDPLLDENGDPVMTTEWTEYGQEERQQFEEMVLKAIGFDAAKHLQVALGGELQEVERRFTVSTQSMRMYQPEEPQQLQAGVVPLDAEAIDNYLRYGLAAIVAFGLLLIARGQLKRSHKAFAAEQERRRREEEERSKREAASADSHEAVMERRLGTKEAIREQILENPQLAGQVLRRWMYE